MHHRLEKMYIQQRKKCYNKKKLPSFIGNLNEVPTLWILNIFLLYKMYGK